MPTLWASTSPPTHDLSDSCESFLEELLKAEFLRAHSVIRVGRAGSPGCNLHFVVAAIRERGTYSLGRHFPSVVSRLNAKGSTAT
jgi:hypothetical protein